MEFRLPAMRVCQGERDLYLFGVDGKQLPKFATVSRIRRDENSNLAGYQRPEILSHIAQIRRYLESDNPLLPNAVVVAFDERVTFEGAPDADADKETTMIGTIRIPVDPRIPDHEKPGWIVDGQQRAAAIRDADVEAFPICVVGFMARDDDDQREQFILVNSTKPLPRGLIYELLPKTGSVLPPRFQSRRQPARLLERMNFDDHPASPFRGRIQTPTNPQGTIKDNSILRMLENSLHQGALFWLDQNGRESAEENMLELLRNYWGAVADVFPEAWELPPRKSRLTHGAGIIAMGALMDTIAGGSRRDGILGRKIFREELTPLRGVCSWTAEQGEWQFRDGSRRKWNDIQNVNKDIRLLADHLMYEYRARVWRAAVRVG